LGSRISSAAGACSAGLLAALLVLPGAEKGPAAPVVPRDLAPPVEKDGWLRPAPGKKSEPVWGVKGGIAVGIWPTSGPRGLLRVYAPYLGQKYPRMINFISIEPTARGQRGLSELERSDSDGVAGKAMWTADTRDARPCPPWEPAAGRVVSMGAVKSLSFFLFVEPFRNGARPVIQVTLRADRPREVHFKLFADRRSAPMRSCVLSATMGNYARLRRVWLKDEVVASTGLWPKFKPDALGFTPWHEWPASRLLVVRGEAIVAATSDEADPAQARYAADVPAHWRYQGKPATQFWRASRQDGLKARVNGRATFWATKAVIPGGVAYENFEMQAPFRAGQEFHFGVSLEPPQKLGFRERSRR
jgi:hypothetical protein